eukprot:sb/3464189/
MLLVNNQHKVPWVEIKLSTNPEHIFITDPFPTLAGVADRLGIILDAVPSYQKPTVPQCSIFECDNSRPEEVLLYTRDYWNREVLPSIERKVHPEYLANSGIPHTPESVMNVLEGGELKGDEPDLVFIVYTIEDCTSCTLALEPLSRLKTLARSQRTRLYFMDCENHEDFCRYQEVDGYPSLLIYTFNPSVDGCPAPESRVTTTAYHGVYQYQGLEEWFKVVSSQGVHYGAPHSFHSTCNVHVVVRTVPDLTTIDRIGTECLVSVCKQLPYAECFITGDGGFVKSIELIRRDGVNGTIYRDGVDLQTTFSDSPDLHVLHGGGEHVIEPAKCHVTPLKCVEMIRNFITSHSRTVVTELTPVLFHSPVSYGSLFGDLPILVAMVPHDVIMTSQNDHLFVRSLHTIATAFYPNLATTFVDVDLYPMWISGMSPVGGEEWVYSFPRVFIFKLEDHRRAAFLRVTGDGITEKVLRGFVEGVLEGRIEMEMCNGI